MLHKAEKVRLDGGPYIQDLYTHKIGLLDEVCVPS
jgi:hypothetical protein